MTAPERDPRDTAGPTIFWTAVVVIALLISAWWLSDSWMAPKK